MSTSSESSWSPADSADRRWQLLAAAVLLFAVMSAAGAVRAVVDGDAERYARWAELAAGLPATVLLLGIVGWKVLRLPRSDRRHFFAIEGYVAEALRAACVRSWLATLVALWLLNRLSRKGFDALPPRFYVDVTMAVMLAAASIVFLTLDAAARHDGGA